MNGHCNGNDVIHRPTTTEEIHFDNGDNQDEAHGREEMESFWKEHSKKATEEEMMLDSNAEELGKEEIPEVLSLLPSVDQLDVVELGAGIGRFTGLLAAKARSVMAIDFMEVFIEKNRELNSHHGNVVFKQADVTKLELPSESVDVVFSNWLLMYLEEKEVLQLFVSILRWLRPGGYFFFRESCFHQSGNARRQHNPTKYRDPATYNDHLQSATIALTDEVEGSKRTKTTYAFEMIMSKSIETYIKLKNNGNQICWLVHKTVRQESNNQGFGTRQEFLDKQLYSLKNIRSYEWVFGEGFISPGGLETTVEFAKMLTLLPGEQVLDVGSSIGGSAFHMAQKYDVHVTGIDLSANMVALALEKAYKVKDKRVQFEMGDVTKRHFRPDSFDAIYSRETLQHIKDKTTLLASFFKWMKPGGRLVITDYCCREGEGLNGWSNQFRNYVQRRGYHLLSIDQYAELLRKVGFRRVHVDDRTLQFIEILDKEVQRLIDVRQEFIEDLSEPEYNSLVNSWKDKLVQCASGDHKYGLIYAEKD